MMSTSKRQNAPERVLISAEGKRDGGAVAHSCPQVSKRAALGPVAYNLDNWFEVGENVH